MNPLRLFFLLALIVSTAPAAYQPARGVTFVIKGANGGPLANAVQYDTGIKLLSGFAINKWSMICYPSGSVTLDILRSANGAGTPSASIVGAGTKPAIATNTESTGTPASWTSTQINTGDNMVAQVFASDGVVVSVTITLGP